MSASLVDFHCHLDLYPDHAEQIGRCERERIFTLAVTTTPQAWARNRDLAQGTKHVRAALGLHPQLVIDRGHEIALWEHLLPQARYVGEVGLDAGPRYYKSMDAQKSVFERVLRACATAGDKILTIHSIRAVAPVLDMIEQHLPAGRGLPVLHWFTGSASEARHAVHLGCYFSINARMLANERGRALIKGLPLHLLLTETDGPFTNVGKSPAQPADVQYALIALAALFEIDVEQMRQQVLRNLQTVTHFGL